MAVADGARLESDVAAFSPPVPAAASPRPSTTRRVLLTGAAGFFGQALLDRICEKCSLTPHFPLPSISLVSPRLVMLVFPHAIGGGGGLKRN